MTDPALVHLRIPAAQKARWVRESRAQGLRLTDWIVQRVERAMPVPVLIPGDLSFTDLQLGRAADGSVSFDLAAIARVERASGLPEDISPSARRMPSPSSSRAGTAPTAPPAARQIRSPRICWPRCAPRMRVAAA